MCGICYPVITQNPDVELAESSARTTTFTSATQANHSAKGLILTVIISAVTATPALTPEIEYSPDGGTTWIDYLKITTPLATTGNYSYLIHPSVTTDEDGEMTESFSLPLPRMWRLVVTAGDTDSATYRAHGQYL